jgi:hypothetical protein
MSIRHARVSQLVTPGGLFWAELEVSSQSTTGKVAVGVATEGVVLHRDFADNTCVGTFPIPSGESQAGVLLDVETGDVLSVGLNLSSGEVHFYLNGDFLETQVVPASSSFYLVGGVSRGCSLSANLFQHVPFQFPPQSGYTDWVVGAIGVPTAIDNQFLSATV